MAANQLTILAPGSIVRGDLFCQDLLVVEGGIQGNVVADRVIIKGQGWVKGNLRCRSLSIELGGIVDGEVVVEEETPRLKNAQIKQGELSTGKGRALLPGQESAPPDEGA